MSSGRAKQDFRGRMQQDDLRENKFLTWLETLSGTSGWEDWTQPLTYNLHKTRLFGINIFQCKANKLQNRLQTMIDKTITIPGQKNRKTIRVPG